MPNLVYAQDQEENQAREGEEARGPTVYVDGEVLELDDPIITIEGRLLVPIRHLAEALHGVVVWVPDTKETLVVSALGDEIIFQPDNPVMRFNGTEYRMDVEPLVVEQRVYIPLRHAAQFLHAEVTWDGETASAHLNFMNPYIVEEGDTLETISEQLDIPEELLIERNQLAEDDLQEVIILKYVIPDIMQTKIEEPSAEALLADEAGLEEVVLPFTDEELELLAKITMVEAGYESYEGQLAVANVILNRVKDPRFPDTIHDVIYAPKQFPPAHNGLLDRAVPNESVWKAVRAAAAGENNVEGAVYFHNPNVSSGRFWNSLTEVAKIGNHRFLK